MLIHQLSDQLTNVTQFFAAPPDVGGGSPPPGSDKIITIIKWIAWIATAACVAGIFIAAGKMAVNHRRGEGGEHASGLAWILGAGILIGSASSIVALVI